jgi:hypothetical protein
MIAATKPTKTATKAKTKTADEIWGTCSSCQTERRLTTEAVLVPHRAWFGLRIGMQPCPCAGLAPAESASLV